MILPDFVIFGAQKAGSTFLLEALRAHSEVFMPREEIAFFEASLYDQNALPDFASNFAAARQDQRVGFKRPNLLGHPESAERMKNDLGADLRLITILRNPIDRAVSAYYHAAATGIIPAKPIEKELPRFLEGQTTHPRASEVLTFGLYDQGLSAFEEHFPFENIHVVLLDDLKQNLTTVFESLCCFLEISEDFGLPDSNKRPMAAPYSMHRIRIKRSLDGLARKWTPDGEYFSFKKGRFWQYYLKLVRGFDQIILKRLFSARPPKLSSSLRNQLCDYYRDDVSSLSQRLDRDLSHWIAPEEAPKT